MLEKKHPYFLVYLTENEFRSGEVLGLRGGDSCHGAWYVTISSAAESNSANSSSSFVMLTAQSCVARVLLTFGEGLCVYSNF